MSVPFYDHAKLYMARKDAIDAAIQRVLASGRLDWGDEVPAFEGEFAAWIGATHAVTVGSGTAALKVALLALGIGRGDEVITVPNTDVASSSAIRFTGADVVWVDVHPLTRTMDPDSFAAAITPRTRAVMPVDLFGHPADLDRILAIAHRHGIAVVEDACIALGATLDERKIGALSDVTCFSFAPTKHLGAYGSGGACLTEDAELAERMSKISGYGQQRSRHRMGGPGFLPQGLHHETDGLNERLDELQAAVLRVKLKDLDANLTARRAQAARYEARLRGSRINPPKVAEGVGHAWRNYVIEADDRDAVRRSLAASGITTSLSYAPPMHLQPVYADLNLGRGSFPVSERICDRLIGLPIGPHLDLEQIDAVADALLRPHDG
ncbi:DegT/DnrJ/EryC1/StrS family aminotransferase [Microvirga sp. BT689]|uniref:DegT/DnrJ/EryC1/StrS family aminotransferase n=1 Tax=Microvirga arvi TaxID=2778731 RepID=UPI0019527323|nr:DegT/DnrJ/EryC1/StrS family aminotransferase [Microvirga arvi]MBM6581862.1 DegT/DnrJ/EryC1/StrS family aminotransferase [Microvirga arvi]